MPTITTATGMKTTSERVPAYEIIADKMLYLNPIPTQIISPPHTAIRIEAMIIRILTIIFGMTQKMQHILF